MVETSIKPTPSDVQILHVSIEPLPDLEALRVIWEELEQRSDGSFFQSWLWIGTWLACLPTHDECRVLSVADPNRTLGLAIIGIRHVTRHGFVRTNNGYLNESGDPHFDALTIEHNGVLADRTEMPQVLAAVVQFIDNAQPGWDEFHMSGVVEQHQLPPQQVASARAKVIGVKPYFFVDLAELRDTGQAYLQKLSSNTRSQIRQTLKAYERIGPLLLREPKGVNEALEFLERLKVLHNAYWTEKGGRGAFATPFQNSFHQRLIEAGFEQQRIQLVRISAGEQDVGYLYNFVHAGRVCAYQSGFVYDVGDSKRRPGLVSHYLAVEHNMNAQQQAYDFLAGDLRYKRSLSTHDGEMSWVAWQKPRLKFMLEDFLAEQKRRVRTWLTPKAMVKKKEEDA